MIPERDIFVQYRVINGVKYIAKNNEAYQLDEIGEIIWESIDGKTSVEEIAEKITEKYNVEYEKVLKDTKQFIDELLNAELIEVCDE